MGTRTLSIQVQFSTRAGASLSLTDVARCMASAAITPGVVFFAMQPRAVSGKRWANFYFECASPATVWPAIEEQVFRGRRLGEDDEGRRSEGEEDSAKHHGRLGFLRLPGFLHYGPNAPRNELVVTEDFGFGPLA